MSGVLVAYASKHGATAEIAAALADQLKAAGLDVDCLPTENVKRLDGYEAVVLGSGVYMKRWLKPARRLLKDRNLGKQAETNFMERGMPNATPPEQRDLRDWDEIRAWADGIADQLGAEH